MKKLMNYNIKDLELVSFFKEGDEYITGEEMLKRAPAFQALGDEDFVNWLEEHQKDIPESWREYHLVFPVLRDRNGDRYVAYLHWDGERWFVDVRWLGSSFGRRGRFVRSRESLGTLSLGSSLALEDFEITVKGKKYRLEEIL